MFDVIIPTYNNLEELKQCLSGLENQTYKNFKVFVCVDGSKDGTIEYLSDASFNFEMLFITHPGNENKGRNETRNLAINKLANKYLLMLDSDIIPSADLLKNHYELLNEKDCISVGEVIYTNSGENIWAKYLETRGKGKYRNLQEMPAYYLNTQNAAMLSEYYVKSGGQHPSLSKKYGGDDTELGYRIGKEFDIPAVFNKKACGYSYLEKSLKKALQQMEEFGRYNLKIIREIHPEFKEIFNFNLLRENNIKSVIIRSLLRKDFAELLKFSIDFLPDFLSLPAVHFLVFYSICKGYKSAEAEK